MYDPDIEDEEDALDESEVRDEASLSSSPPSSPLGDVLRRIAAIQKTLPKEQEVLDAKATTRELQDVHRRLFHSRKELERNVREIVQNSLQPNLYVSAKERRTLVLEVLDMVRTTVGASLYDYEQFMEFFLVVSERGLISHLFKLLREDNLEPSAKCYEHLLHAQGVGGNLQACLNTIEEMKAYAGPKSLLRKVHYESALKTAGQKGDVSVAISLLSDMQFRFESYPTQTAFFHLFVAIGASDTVDLHLSSARVAVTEAGYDPQDPVWMHALLRGLSSESCKETLIRYLDEPLPSSMSRSQDTPPLSFSKRPSWEYAKYLLPALVWKGETERAISLCHSLALGGARVSGRRTRLEGTEEEKKEELEVENVAVEQLSRHVARVAIFRSLLATLEYEGLVEEADALLETAISSHLVSLERTAGSTQLHVAFCQGEEISTVLRKFLRDAEKEALNNPAKAERAVYTLSWNPKYTEKIRPLGSLLVGGSVPKAWRFQWYPGNANLRIKGNCLVVGLAEHGHSASHHIHWPQSKSGTATDAPTAQTIQGEGQQQMKPKRRQPDSDAKRRAAERAADFRKKNKAKERARKDSTSAAKEHDRGAHSSPPPQAKKKAHNHRRKRKNTIKKDGEDTERRGRAKE